MRKFLLVALLVGACNSKSKSGSEQNGAATASSSQTTATTKLTLIEAGFESNKVTVELAVPSSWRVDSSMPASWKTDGALTISVTNVSAGGSDNPARLAHGIKMQFGDATKVTRKDYPDGRAWLWETQDNGTIHARMFIPYAGGVVMGIAVLADKSKLDDMRAAFETLKIVQ